MFLKKHLCLLLTAALLISLLVSCGGGAKEDATPAEAEPVQAEEPAPEAEPEEAAVSAGPGGHYILTELTEDGEVYGTDMIAYFGGESSIDLNDDGTFVLVLPFDDLYLEGTWTDGAVSVEGTEIPFTYDADAMTVFINDEEDGLGLLFTHESVAPEINYVIWEDDDFDWDDGDDSGYFLNNFIIPETVIYDEGGITVTLTGVEDDGDSGYEVSYTIINGSDQDIDVGSSCFAINGCMLEYGLYDEAAAGKNKAGEFTIAYEDLQRACLYQFYELSIDIEVSDDETWETVGDSGLVNIFVDEDTMQNGYTADDLPYGELLFDNNGVQVYFLSIEDDGWDSGDGLAYFAIVNGSGHKLRAQTGDISYNGWMVYDGFGVTIPDGYWSITSMGIYDYESANLESWADITDIEFTLILRDKDTKENICDDTIVSVAVG